MMAPAFNNTMKWADQQQNWNGINNFPRTVKCKVLHFGKSRQSRAFPVNGRALGRVVQQWHLGVQTHSSLKVASWGLLTFIRFVWFTDTAWKRVIWPAESTPTIDHPFSSMFSHFSTHSLHTWSNFTEAN